MASRLRVLGTVGVVVMMFGLMAVQSASAFTWTDSKLFTNGQTEAVRPAPGGVLEAEISGTKVKMTATGYESFETKITQEESVAGGSGRLKLTNLSLIEPAGCTPPASVTTSALKTKLVEVPGLASGLGARLFPASGTEFASFTLSGSCALAGTPIKLTTVEGVGTCGEVSPLGTMAIKQLTKTSAAINSSCGGSLSAGGNPATITGEVNAELVSGAIWGAAKSESGITWTNASPFVNGQSENVRSAERGVLKGIIAGAEVEMTTTAIEFINAHVTQKETTAVGSGQLKLSGLTLVKPAGCTPPASIQSTALSVEVFQKGSPATTYLKLVPTTGTVFATVTLGGVCALAGTPFKVSTSTYACGETSPLGTMAVRLLGRSSEKIMSACGGTLSAGGNPASVTGEWYAELASGETWGAQ